MRARYFVALACAICTAGAFSCSDDGESQEMMGLQPQGGSGGTSNGGSSSSNAGSSNGGSANGGTAGSQAQGGSANPGGGGSGQAGAAGNGMAGSSMAEAGSSGDTPDAGGGDDGPPDSGSPDEPDEETVGFSDVFPILRANCGGCHGNPNGGLPAFAQANEAMAYAVTQANNAQISQRIIARAVTARTMPPGCNGGQFGQGQCIDADEAADLQAWLDDGALP